MNFSSLNDAIRYTLEQERQAFEKAIDSDPLETTNHLVYADWLQENGEEEEAAFRRAMGNWIGEGHHEHKPGTGWFLHNSKPLPSGKKAGTYHRQARYYAGSGNNRWDTYRQMESDLRKAFQISSSYSHPPSPES
jgi:uncharacterized protein (TIGR02996 family)